MKEKEIHDTQAAEVDSEVSALVDMIALECAVRLRHFLHARDAWVASERSRVERYGHAVKTRAGT